jgi:hypothetical protein
MRMRALHVLAAIAVTVLGSPANAQDPCDAVLVNQVSFLAAQDKQSESWLRIVDESSYSAAKQKGSASIYGNWFSGDYQNFKTKRDRYFSQSAGSVSRESAVEEFKSYLSESQVQAWLACKGTAATITTHYKDVDAVGATIVIKWPAGTAIGPLREPRFQLIGVTEAPRFSSSTFAGETSFLVERRTADTPIRGSVSGIAGFDGRAFQATIYIPPYREPTNVKPPLKEVTSLRNVIVRSTAYWGNGSAGWDCEKATADKELIVISSRDNNIGRRRGRCVGRGSFCNSHNEYCVETVATAGCYVNRRWLDWYRGQLEALGEAYRRESVCDPSVLT